MVNLANSIFAHASRRINLLHLPVPRERDDAGFYEPLRRLQSGPTTKLALGLVHHTGGLEGTLRRMKTADKLVGDYAIGTDCGMGRRPPETIPELLRFIARPRKQRNARAIIQSVAGVRPTGM